jgi:hypothetical protein
VEALSTSDFFAGTESQLVPLVVDCAAQRDGQPIPDGVIR